MGAGDYRKKVQRKKPAAKTNVTPMSKMPKYVGAPKTDKDKWRAAFGLTAEQAKAAKAKPGGFVQTSGQKPFGGKAEAPPVSIEQAMAVSRRMPQANAPQSQKTQGPGYLYPGRLQELTAGTGYFPDVTRWEPGNIGPGIHPSIITPPQPGGIDNQGRRVGPPPTTGDFLNFFGNQPASIWAKPQFGPPAPQWPPPMYELPPLQGPPAPLPNEQEVPSPMPAFTGGPVEYEDGGGGWGGGGGGGGGGYPPYSNKWLQQLYSWRL